MFIFLCAIFSLNIYKLEIKTRNYIIFDHKTSSVLSYGFIRDFLPVESQEKNINCFSFENEDLSELFIYNVVGDDNRLIENRIYIVQNDKRITQNIFNISVNENCEIVELNPKFSIGKYDDNIQKIEVKNIKNYSKCIWDNFIQEIINNNRFLVINSIERILNEHIDHLKFFLNNYPLLYFYNSFEKIQTIFSIILEKIKDRNFVKFETICNSLKYFCENESENIIMQRFYSLKGQEITEESKDFFLSCLLTDIFNILKYFTSYNKYKFKIFNFIELKNSLYGEFWIGCEINLDYKTVKRNCQNKPFIFLYDVNNNKIKKFIVIGCDKNFFIMLHKIWCLNNHLEMFKIIIHTNTKIYESQYLEIKKNVYD